MFVVVGCGVGAILKPGVGSFGEGVLFCICSDVVADQIGGVGTGDVEVLAGVAALFVVQAGWTHSSAGQLAHLAVGVVGVAGRADQGGDGFAELGGGVVGVVGGASFALLALIVVVGVGGADNGVDFALVAAGVEDVALGTVDEGDDFA